MFPENTNKIFQLIVVDFTENLRTFEKSYIVLYLRLKTWGRSISEIPKVCRGRCRLPDILL